MPRTNACKYCGKEGLKWSRTSQGWKLVNEEGEQHKCQSRTAECRYCGQGGFEWKREGEKWALWKDGEKHTCQRTSKCRYCGQDGFEWRQDEEGKWGLWKEEEKHSCQRPPQKKECRRCHERGLTLEKKESDDGKWHLYEPNGERHSCRATFAERRRQRQEFERWGASSRMYSSTWGAGR